MSHAVRNAGRVPPHAGRVCSLNFGVRVQLAFPCRSLLCLLISLQMRRQRQFDVEARALSRCRTDFQSALQRAGAAAEICQPVAAWSRRQCRVKAAAVVGKFEKQMRFRRWLRRFQAGTDANGGSVGVTAIVFGMEVAREDAAACLTMPRLLQRRRELVTLLSPNCHWTLGGFSG